MILILERNSHNQFGTFGKLRVASQTFYTVEQDWEDNKPNVSCIPNGTYDFEHYISPKHGDSFILSNHEHNVGKYPGEAKRSSILMHKANLASQLRGCLAPGMGLGYYKEQWSVRSSTKALERIFTLLPPGEKHQIVIYSSFPSFKEGE